ncbi:MAG: hypothetical protein Q8Q14_06355 [Gemmatimonadales bacterium]|nr:hypothetical protein [Gemmatimonadales bacterium]
MSRDRRMRPRGDMGALDVPSAPGLSYAAIYVGGMGALTGAAAGLAAGSKWARQGRGRAVAAGAGAGAGTLVGTLMLWAFVAKKSTW